MPSIRSRIFLKLFRNRHIFQLKLREDPFDPSIEGLHTFREKAEKGARIFGKVPKGLEVVPSPINDMYAEWIRPVVRPTKKQSSISMVVVTLWDPRKATGLMFPNL